MPGRKACHPISSGCGTTATSSEHPDWEIRSLSEEHGQVHVPPGAAAPKVGERVTVIPNHVCMVTNLTDRITAVRKGRVETSYAVAARGKVQ